MIDVDRGKPVAEPGRERMQDVQQNNRIDAAGQTRRETLAAQARRGKHPGACAGQARTSARQFP